MEKVKIVMCDLDGTLLNHDEMVSMGNQKAIQKLKEHGYLFGLATGRPLCSVETLVDRWGIKDYVDVVLSLNGGHVKDYNLNQEEKYYTIDGEHIREVVEFFKGQPVNFGVYVDNYLAVMYDDALAVRLANSDAIPYKVVDFETIYDKPQSKLIVIVDPSDMPQIVEHSKGLSNPAYKSLQAGKIEYEYMHPQLSKSFGLQKVCEWHGYTLENLMAFGDADNDADMIRDAGVGVAMANASEKTKGYSNYMTLDNEHDGVGLFLEEMLFEEIKV